MRCVKTWTCPRLDKAATLDSVKAILRRLSYLMLSNNFGCCGKILPQQFESESSFNKAKGLLLKGSGLGEEAGNC